MESKRPVFLSNVLAELTVSRFSVGNHCAVVHGIARDHVTETTGRVNRSVTNMARAHCGLTRHAAGGAVSHEAPRLMPGRSTQVNEPKPLRAMRQKGCPQQAAWIFANASTFTRRSPRAGGPAGAGRRSPSLRRGVPPASQGTSSARAGEAPLPRSARVATGRDPRGPLAEAGRAAAVVRPAA